MNRRIAIVLVLLVALSMTGARADHTPVEGCPIHLSETSASSPNLVDGVNDWDGVVTGNGSGTIPYADVYREGTDITQAWLHRDATGAMTAHIEVQTLSALQPNTIFYFRWLYNGSDATKRVRYVSAKLKGYSADFFYGYFTAGTVGTFTTVGSTTGRIIDGSPGEIVIDIPSGLDQSGASRDDWGAPAPGSILGGMIADARVLIGSPETLPQNPSGVRSGLTGVADNTEDGFVFCDGYVEA